MNYVTEPLEPLTFTVLLTLSAHSRAKEFGYHQSDPQKAQQVYHNTLAVYAVNYYLQCLEFETNLEASDSYNPVMQTLMDIADLEVKDCGKLECRPVLGDSQVCYFPAEVWSERIGYVAVQLNESLSRATLLGFFEQAQTEELPLSQLRPLEDLSSYLSENKSVLVHLKKWLEGVFTDGWLTREAVFSTEASNLAFNTRVSNFLSESDPGKLVVNVSRGKLIDLGIQLVGHPVALIVAVAPFSDEEMDILVQVYPGVKGQFYLPLGLQLIVMDESGATSLETQARSWDNWIQLQFLGGPGEHFSVKLAFGDVSITEYFVI